MSEDLDDDKQGQDGQDDQDDQGPASWLETDGHDDAAAHVDETAGGFGDQLERSVEQQPFVPGEEADREPIPPAPKAGGEEDKQAKKAKPREQEVVYKPGSFDFNSIKDRLSHHILDQRRVQGLSKPEDRLSPLDKFFREHAPFSSDLELAIATVNGADRLKLAVIQFAQLRNLINDRRSSGVPGTPTLESNKIILDVTIELSNLILHHPSSIGVIIEELTTCLRELRDEIPLYKLAMEMIEEGASGKKKERCNQIVKFIDYYVTEQSNNLLEMMASRIERMKEFPVVIVPANPLDFRASADTINTILLDPTDIAAELRKQMIKARPLYS